MCLMHVCDLDSVLDIIVTIEIVLDIIMSQKYEFDV